MTNRNNSNKKQQHTAVQHYSIKCQRRNANGVKHICSRTMHPAAGPCKSPHFFTLPAPNKTSQGDALWHVTTETQKERLRREIKQDNVPYIDHFSTAITDIPAAPQGCIDMKAEQSSLDSL